MNANSCRKHRYCSVVEVTRFAWLLDPAETIPATADRRKDLGSRIKPRSDRRMS